MRITVTKDAKTRIARAGAVRIFGDFDERKTMNEQDLVRLFDNAWSSGLDSAVAQSLECEYKVAYSRLKERHRDFLDPSEEQRQFRYQEMEFIAQLRSTGKSSKELTQLWRVQSGDDRPKTIFVTFESVPERQEFRSIAEKLGWHDEELALSLLRDFMSKFENKNFPSEPR
jgi:hypothetical protein